MKLRRIIASVFVAVALLGAGFVPAASAAPAAGGLVAPAKTTVSKAATKVKVTSKPKSGTQSKSFKVKGKVTPARKGTIMVVQRYSKGSWASVGTARTTSKGAFSVSVKTAKSGSVKFRVVSKETPHYKRAVSSTFTVKLQTRSAARAAKAVSVAKKQVGKKYRYGSSGPSAFDCSGLTSYAYKAAGVKLSHSARTQSKKGKKVAKKDLKAGDLVFFYSPISHVGIYIGGGKVVHAGSTRTGVEIASLSWMPYSGARRVS